MIRTVIFDLDGVIVNSEPVHQRLESKMFRELNLEITEKDRKSLVGMSAVDMWKYIRKAYDIDIDPKELLLHARKKYWYILENTDEVKLIPGVRDFIKSLKNHGLNLLVASSASSVTVNKVLDIFDLQMWFSGMVGGDEVINSKPDPEIFLKAASLIEANPLECLVIEDSTNGILAAKEAGMKSIGLQNHDTVHQDLSEADWVVDDLDDIELEVVLK
ncbi:HAD family hydrolase [Bacteroidota bacterium]